jgi:hypothetical protein
MTTRTLSLRHVLTWSIAVLAAVAALAGATVGYQLMSDPGPAAAATTQHDPGTAGRAGAPHHHVARAVVVKYRPCPRGFERRQDTCVRTLQRTHVVHVAAPAPAPAPSVAPASTGVSATSAGSVAAPSAGDDHGGAGSAHERDDHGDDHGREHGEDRGGHESGDDHGSDDGPGDD